MTISVQSARDEYVGNGATQNFATTFEFQTAADLKVYQADVLKALTTHYTVSGGAGSVGTVTFLVAPAVSEGVVIFDDPALTQGTDYTPNDPFPAESHELALDKLTRIARRLADQVARSAVLSPSDTSGASIVLPPAVSSRLIGWNAAATALENKEAADLTALTVVSAYIATLFDDTDAATARTTLGALASAAGAVLAANLATDAVETLKIKDLNVTTGKLADLAVTTGKLADGSVTLDKIGSGVIAPVGSIVAMAANILPAGGFIPCQGSSVSTTTYAALFAIIGYTYGGAGASFNVPDFSGMFLRGEGTTGTHVSDAVGTLQEDTFEAHTHEYSNAPGGIGGVYYPYSAGPGYAKNSIQTGSTGDTETRPANYAVLYCIKY